jgi:hypothetical protein
MSGPRDVSGGLTVRLPFWNGLSRSTCKYLQVVSPAVVTLIAETPNCNADLF